VRFIVQKVRDQFASAAAPGIRTLVETTLHNTDQLVINRTTQQAGLDYDYFLYAGPEDVRARPICRHMVNRVFPRAAIEQCDNGQLPDFQISRGGFNCRHRLRPMTLTELGYLPKQIEVVEPFRMVAEVTSAADAKVERFITYPVLLEIRTGSA